MVFKCKLVCDFSFYEHDVFRKKEKENKERQKRTPNGFCLSNSVHYFEYTSAYF